MGEVYRAADTKFSRNVAIKVVPDAFALDGDRIARFEREAKVLASLNHPHVAALHSFEEAAGRHFLVMELVEGETLAERLQRGPMTVGEALKVAHQIADALEAAHEKGIVHRDLKPANVKITPEDRVKVLDFGLARLQDEPDAATRPNLTNSPTLGLLATQAGVILGTAAYMSPEQAKGAAADHRSDMFSFGAVLYEMLTGRQAFQAETPSETMAAVLMREPDFATLPANLNPRLTELVRRCLEKPPKRRWQAAGDLRAEIEAIMTAPQARAESRSGGHTQATLEAVDPVGDHGDLLQRDRWRCRLVDRDALGASHRRAIGVSARPRAAVHEHRLSYDRDLARRYADGLCGRRAPVSARDVGYRIEAHRKHRAKHRRGGLRQTAVSSRLRHWTGHSSGSR